MIQASNIVILSTALKVACVTDEKKIDEETIESKL